ncbi:MAG TPA: hypothetical protein VG488_00960 [Candidatus Angelobacter sp.]|jgi:tetratricopeptide (TPR) repeat protein|nr:hypothetical protein [Candidatus Angelobacter sp.]
MKVLTDGLALALLLGLWPTASPAQHLGHLGHSSGGPGNSPCELKDGRWKAPIGLLPDIGSLNHPVGIQKGKEKAQAFFNQGLTLFYSFDGEGAMRSFHQASEIDPDLAMAHWGVALAAGGDLNIPVDDPCLMLAVSESKKAVALLPKTQMKSDRDYVSALAKRYDADAPDDAPRDPRGLELQYMLAMRKVYEDWVKTDPDSATLYAGALLNLRPWFWWDNSGRDSAEAKAAIKVLKDSLGLPHYLSHIGLNHYLIHALEEAPPPTELSPALQAAIRLRGLAPAAAPHLVHMPSHIFFLAGDYENVIMSNRQAIDSDERWIKDCDVTKICNKTLIGHYHSHDLLFLAVGYANRGVWSEVKSISDRLEQNASKYLEEEAGLERYLTTRALMMVRFGKWAEIRAAQPPEKVPDNFLSCEELPRKLAAAAWYYAKASAFTMPSSPAGVAEVYLQRFVKAKQCVQSAAIGWGNNTAADILDITHWVLLQRMARSRKAWEEGKWYALLAVETEDLLTYDEPPGWYTPARESLGAAQFQAGNYQGALVSFDQELQRHPNSSRSLYGRFKCLEKLRPSEAAKAKEAFDKQWTPGEPMPDLNDM